MGELVGRGKDEFQVWTVIIGKTGGERAFVQTQECEDIRKKKLSAVEKHEREEKDRYHRKLA